jgi:hypothetical protein
MGGNDFGGIDFSKLGGGAGMDMPGGDEEEEEDEEDDEDMPPLEDADEADAKDAEDASSKPAAA